MSTSDADRVSGNAPKNVEELAMGVYTKYQLSGKSCLAIGKALAGLLVSVQCGLHMAYRIRVERQKAKEQDVYGLDAYFRSLSSTPEPDPGRFIDPSTWRNPDGVDIAYGPKGPGRKRTTVGAMIYWGELDAHITQRHKQAEYQRKIRVSEKFDGQTTYFTNDEQIIDLAIQTLTEPQLLYDDTNYPDSFSLFRTFPTPVGIRPGQFQSSIRGIQVAVKSQDGNIWRVGTIHPLDHQPLSVNKSKILRQPSNENGAFGMNF